MLATRRSRHRVTPALALTLALLVALVGPAPAGAQPGGPSSGDDVTDVTQGASAADPTRVRRIFGADRVATAAALARAAHTGPVPIAYVATSGAFPDALTGGPAAAAEEGPLLLVHRAALPGATADALRALRPERIVVLGGTEAVSPEVLRGLDALTAGPVERRSGADRFATAAAVSAAAHPDGAPVAVLASGEDFADALAGGAAAARLGGPLLLVQRDALPASTATELRRLGADRAVLLGGTAAVTERVAAAIGAATGSPVQRLAGRTRFETAEAVARAVFGDTEGDAVLATGVAFPDALAATPFAARADGPILLTAPGVLPAGVGATLRDLDPGRVTVAGGRGAVHENAEAMAREALGAAPDGHRQDDALEPQDLWVTTTDAVLDELYRNPFRDGDRLPAVLSRAPGGPPIALEGIELRGFSSRLLPKKSFDIRASGGQPFLFGSARMNANAGYTDPSLMRERLGFGAFTEVGQPAPRTRHFDLHLNGVYEGLYTHIERVDGDLLEHLGLNPDGMLLRDEIREVRQSGDRSVPDRQSTFGLDLRTVADPQGLLRKVFTDRSGTDADFARLDALVRWVHDTPAGDAFATGFAQRFDVENVVTWLAIHSVIGDMDAFGDDYWLYVDHTTPGSRWLVIPWDKDLTFGSHTRPSAPHPGTANDYFAYEYELRSGFGNVLVERILATPALRRQVDARILELIDGPLSPASFAERITTIASVIGDDVDTPPGPRAFRRNPGQHHGALGRHALHAENLRDFTELRSAFLRRRLQPSGGEAYRATVDLRGVAAGERVLFTDARGFTIGALTVTENRQAGTAALTVAPDSGVDGVRRRYAMELDTGAVVGDLSLYYRNEVYAVRGAPAENWYATTEAVGGQTRLQMTVNGRPLASRPNPYSNKVTARLEIGPRTTELRLVHG